MGFQQVIELFDYPAWVWSMSGVCVARNPAVAATVDDPLPDAAVRDDILARLAAAPGRTMSRAVELPNAEGHRIWFPCRFRSWIEEGRVTAVIAICDPPPSAAVRDAEAMAAPTGRARSAQDMEDGKLTSEVEAQVVARVAQNAPAALFEAHAHTDGTISVPFFNAQLAELFGVSVDKMRKKRSLTFENIHPEDQSRMLVSRLEAMRLGSVHDIKYRVRHASRGTIWLHTRSQPQLQPDGTTIFYGTVHDVTKQMEAEARAEVAATEARRAQERLRRFSRHSPVSLYELRRCAGGMFSFDYVTRNMAELLGVPLEVLKEDGAAAFGNVPQEELPALLDAFERSAGDLTLFDITCRLRRDVGSYRQVELRATPKRTEDGGTVWYGVAYDATEQLETQRRLKEAMAETEKGFALVHDIADSAPAGLAQILLHADGRREVVYLNAQMHRHFGVERDEFIASRESAFRCVHPEDREKLTAQIAERTKTLRPMYCRARVLHPEGGMSWLIYEANCRRRKDGTVVWNCSSVDVTDQLALERKAREALDRLQRIANSVPVGLYETLKPVQGLRRLDFANKRFIEMVGITATEPEAQWGQLLEAIHPEDRARTLGMQKRTSSDRDLFRFRITPKNGDTIWVGAMVTPNRDANGRPALAGAFTDITEDVEREEELRRAHEATERARLENERQALHDALTDLPNRRYFDAHMAKLFAEARESEDAVRITLIRIDGDRFKYVNDTFGHEAGDAVLQRIGEVMRAECRRLDFPARVGGDEFSILLHGDDQEDETHAAALVERIKEGLDQPLYFGGNPCSIQASFGVATVDALQEGPEELLMFADAALYRAKEQGRNRMELFTPELRAAITNERQIITDLHTAIERDEIEPYFQVQVDSRAGRLTGVEALMRWNHPSRGVLAPDAFLHLADKLRVTAELDGHMKRKAHAALRDLRAQGFEVPRISFNASAGRLRDKAIVSDVKRLIDDGFHVALELLESIMVEEEDDSFRFTLDSLREIGVELEIDDFGSGRASVLGLLEVAPVALKIDKRLILHVEEEPSVQKLVRAVVDIADALDISTICEGVERKGQLRTLQALGCNVMQGYYFSRPLCAASLAALLKDPPWVAISERRTG